MQHQNEVDQRFWIIKTTVGAHGRSYWPDFWDNKVVAVGWGWINVDPSKAHNKTELYKPITQQRPKLSTNEQEYIARIVYKFTKVWNSGDKAIICRGYTSTQAADVHLYGIATVGKFLYRPESEWWLFQREADIERIERDIPKHIFVDSLNLETSRLTIHQITEEGFKDFNKKIPDSNGFCGQARNPPMEAETRRFCNQLS